MFLDGEMHCILTQRGLSSLDRWTDYHELSPWTIQGMMMYTMDCSVFTLACIYDLVCAVSNCH